MPSIPATSTLTRLVLPVLLCVSAANGWSSVDAVPGASTSQPVTPRTSAPAPASTEESCVELDEGALRSASGPWRQPSVSTTYVIDGSQTKLEIEAVCDRASKVVVEVRVGSRTSRSPMTCATAWRRMVTGQPGERVTMQLSGVPASGARLGLGVYAPKA